MKILIHFRHFPVAMGRWFDWAFRDLGYEVFSVGNYSGGKIPWGDQFDFPQYAFPPDYEIPEVDNYPIDSLLKEIPFKPDVIVQAADVCYLSGKAPCKNVVLMTDPHAVDYNPRLQFADHAFNMQNFYKTDEQTWIPYAYYPPVHKRLELPQKYDVVFSGLQYDHRKEALSRMENTGLRVLSTLGLIYEEYVRTYNEGLIAFNWSSKQDLPARFWEGLAMGRLVLTNRVPDLEKISLQEGRDYVAYSSVDEAVEKAKYYSTHKEEAETIMKSGKSSVSPHHYLARAKKMISIIKKL